MTGLNRRLITAQSWWLGSELVRRHPNLSLSETHPGGGMNDCLSVIRPARNDAETLVELNREGSLHVTVGDQTGFLSWEQERDFGDRHGAVKRLEAAAQLQAPPQTPGSTPAVLTFRTIARVLAGLLNEREQWDARNQWLDTSDYGYGPRFDLSAFPSAATAVREQRPTDLFGRPEYRFWVLLRGDEPMAVLDTDGQVHLASGQSSLPDAYTKAGHRLTAAIAATLGGVLP